MSFSNRPYTRTSIVLALMLFVPVAARAQATTTRPTSAADRLFLSFAEDATVADYQWWEGQVEFVDFDPTEALILRAVVAVQPLEGFELGGRVGFGNTDSPEGLPDGSGATDLDIWGKYYFTAGAQNTEFAFGGLATIPTGDDRAGLGFDAFSVEVFGSLRYGLPDVILAGNIGVRLNEDGSVQGFSLDGEVAPFIGGAVIYVVSDQVSLVGELDLEGERFRETDTDFRALGGVNWRVTNRGMVRGAVAFGLADGAPDSQLLVGYAHRF